MDSQVVEAWERYREAVRSLYIYEAETEELNEDTLLEVLARSGELGEALDDRLRAAGRAGVEGQVEVNELETATMAAATIDFAVGGGVLSHAMRGEIGDDVPSDVPPEVLAAAAEVGEPESMEELLELANRDFPHGQAMAGSGPGLPFARERAQQGIDELVSVTVPLANKFGTGLITVGATSLFDAVGAFEVVHGFADGVSRKVRYGIRLVRKAIAKLVSFLGSVRVLDIATHLHLEGLMDLLANKINALSVGFWRFLARAEKSELLVDAALAGREVDSGKLDDQLRRLSTGMEEKMTWGERIDKKVKLLAVPALFFLPGGPGHALVAGANGIGLTVTLFLLTDRLDTDPWGLGRVVGVPGVVRECWIG